MEQIKLQAFQNSLNYLFKETFEGSPASGSIYLDRGIGIFNTIADLDAEAASKQMFGATIAAHTDHLRYYLDVLSNFLKGTVQIANWQRSWEIKHVSEDEWKAIKRELRKTYDSAVKGFKDVTEWDEDKISEAMAMVVHSAYHLSAIRQIAKGA